MITAKYSGCKSLTTYNKHHQLATYIVVVYEWRQKSEKKQSGEMEYYWETKYMYKSRFKNQKTIKF